MCDFWWNHSGRSRQQLYFSNVVFPNGSVHFLPKNFFACFSEVTILIKAIRTNFDAHDEVPARFLSVWQSFFKNRIELASEGGCALGFIVEEMFVTRRPAEHVNPDDLRVLVIRKGAWLFRWFKFTLKPPYSIARDNLRLAIWDTSFWTFWLKFGHKGPWEIS